MLSGSRGPLRVAATAVLHDIFIPLVLTVPPPSAPLLPETAEASAPADALPPDGGHDAPPDMPRGTTPFFPTLSGYARGDEPDARTPSPVLYAYGLFTVFVVLIAFVVDILVARNQELKAGELELTQHARLLAEHAARSFDSVEVLLDELNRDLSGGHRWWEWSDAHGHEFLRQRMTRTLPQIRHLIVFDSQGTQRFSGSFYPSNPINISDRVYFQRLKDGDARTRYGPYVGRNSNRHTYAVARRLERPNHVFAGVLMAALEPQYFEDFCWSTRPDDSFQAALVNNAGILVALCRQDADDQDEFLGRDFREVMAERDFRHASPLAESLRSERHLLAQVEVPGYDDLRLITVRTTESTLRQWRTRQVQVIALALVAAVSLLIAGLLIRRQFIGLRTLTVELTGHRDNLAQRVRQATREIETRRRDAERANRAKTRFLAAASHDLRQPLHALHMFLSDLRQTPLAPDQQSVLKRIEVATGAMGDQLESLLEISRLDLTRIEPERQAVPVTDLFAGLAATYAPLAEASGVTLRFHPPRRGSGVLETDPALLSRLLGNLIDNAIKFTPGGRVLVCARRHGPDHLRIEVRDNGIGVPAEHQEGIFEEFYQVGNTARQAEKGLGLGLAIVRRLADLLGHRVRFASRPGVGTVFGVVIPNPPRPRFGTAPRGPGVTVLSAFPPNEDERALLATLSGWGYAIRHEELPLPAGRLLPGRHDPYRVTLYCKRQPGPFGDEELATLLQGTVIVIAPEKETHPALPNVLNRPLRPARLRALLRSLAPQQENGLGRLGEFPHP